jgi:hypothetical protein
MFWGRELDRHCCLIRLQLTEALGFVGAKVPSNEKQMLGYIISQKITAV